MSGLSSRVMTMKFMQKDPVKEEESTNKVKDTSEWVLPHAAQLVKQTKKKRSNITESVGYGSINSFGTLALSDEEEDKVTVRKTYGKKEEPPKEDREKKQQKPKKDTGSLDSLESLWNKSKKLKKRESDEKYVPDIPNKRTRFPGLKKDQEQN